MPEILAGVQHGSRKMPGSSRCIGVFRTIDPVREEVLIRIASSSWRPAGMLVAGLEHTDRARAPCSRVAASGWWSFSTLTARASTSWWDHRTAWPGRKSAGASIRRATTGASATSVTTSRWISARANAEGFRAALAEIGMGFVDQELTLPAASSMEAGRIGLARLLERQPGLDAIYFSNDDLALGGYFHCLEHDISVPSRLALFGYNGLEITRLTPQPLSTIRSPQNRHGASGRQSAAFGRAFHHRRMSDLSLSSARRADNPRPFGAAPCGCCKIPAISNHPCVAMVALSHIAWQRCQIVPKKQGVIDNIPFILLALWACLRKW